MRSCVFILAGMPWALCQHWSCNIALCSMVVELLLEVIGKLGVLAVGRNQIICHGGFPSACTLF